MLLTSYLAQSSMEGRSDSLKNVNNTDLAAGLDLAVEVLPDLAPGAASPTVGPGVEAVAGHALRVDHLFLLRNREAIPLWHLGIM